MRLMTKRDTFIEADVMMNMLMWLEDWDGRVPMPAVLKPRPLWTGKQVGSVVGHCHSNIHSSTMHLCRTRRCEKVPSESSDARCHSPVCRLQIVNLFLPRVNCRRFASWYKDGEPADMSPTDSQVRRVAAPPQPGPALTTDMMRDSTLSGTPAQRCSCPGCRC